jgi:ribose transport system permease protein
VGLLAIVAVSWVIFGIFTTGFVSEFNVYSMSRSAAVAVVIGLSQMVVIALGQMNISVGAIGGVVAMFTGFLVQVVGVPFPIAILLGIGFGGLLGLINGVVIARTRINSFVITLGTASVFSGLMYIATKVEAFRNLPADFLALGQARWLGISPLAFGMVLAGALLWFIYKRTTLGRQMLATGANPVAARLSGIPTDRMIETAHVLSGGLAGLAGIMLVLRIGSAIPSIGEDWVLASFAAPAIGGTLLSGGVVSVVGTFVGGLLLATIGNGLTLLNIPNFWVELSTGLVLLVAVILDRVRAVTITRSRAARFRMADQATPSPSLP